MIIRINFSNSESFYIFKGLSINMSSIFGLFNSLQNIKNNNDENEILNNLEEVEFNEQFKIEEEIK